MKKLIITMGIILATMAGFSQVAPTSVSRVADAETVFGINISVGKQVYNIATEQLWVATEGVAGTATLKTAASSFKIVNGTGTTNLAEANFTKTTVDITSSTGTKATLESATTIRAGLMTADQFDKLDAVEAGAQVNYTLITEKFEETSETATTHELAHTAQTGGCTVSLNGTVLDPSYYTLTAADLKINLPVAQYDIVLITYNY